MPGTPLCLPGGGGGGGLPDLPDLPGLGGQGSGDTGGGLLGGLSFREMVRGAE